MILGWFEDHILEILKRWRTDKQTNKQTEFQLVDSTPPVGGVEWKCGAFSRCFCPLNWPFFRKVVVFQNWGPGPSILEKWSFTNALSVAPCTMIMVRCQSVFQNWGPGPSILEKAPTINESSWTRHQSKIAQNYCWFTVQRGPLICIISDEHLIGQAWKRCI